MPFCEVVGNIICSNLVELCGREFVVGVFDANEHRQHIDNVPLVVFDLFAGHGYLYLIFHFCAMAYPKLMHQCLCWHTTTKKYKVLFEMWPPSHMKNATPSPFWDVAKAKNRSCISSHCQKFKKVKVLRIC